MLFIDDVENLQRQVEELNAKIEAISPRIERIDAILEIIDRFDGWDAFRKQYLEGVRLRQLEQAAAAALNGTEADRLTIRGQLDENKILCQSRSSLDKQRKMMLYEQTGMEKRKTTILRKLERKQT